MMVSISEALLMAFICLMLGYVSGLHSKKKASCAIPACTDGADLMTKLSVARSQITVLEAKNAQLEAESDTLNAHIDDLIKSHDAYVSAQSIKIKSIHDKVCELFNSMQAKHELELQCNTCMWKEIAKQNGYSGKEDLI